MILITYIFTCRPKINSSRLLLIFILHFPLIRYTFNGYLSNQIDIPCQVGRPFLTIQWGIRFSKRVKIKNTVHILSKKDSAILLLHYNALELGKQRQKSTPVCIYITMPTRCFSNSIVAF